MIFADITRTTNELQEHLRTLDGTVHALRREARRMRGLYDRLKAQLTAYEATIAALTALIPRLVLALRAAQTIPYAGAVVRVVRQVLRNLNRILRRLRTATGRIRRAVSRIDAGLTAIDALVGLPNTDFDTVDDVTDEVIEIALWLEEQQEIIEPLLPASIKRQLRAYVRFIDQRNSGLKPLNQALDAVLGVMRAHNGVLGTIVSALEAKLPQLEELQPVIDFIEEFVTQARADVEELLQWVPDALTSAAQWIVEALDALLDEITEALGFNEFISGLLEDVPFIDEIVTAFRQFENAIDDLTGPVLRALRQRIEDLMRQLREIIARVRAVYAILRALGSFKEVFERLLTVHAAQMKRLLRLLARKLAQLPDGGAGGLADTWEKFWDTARDATEKLEGTPLFLNRLAPVAAVADELHALGDLAPRMTRLVKRLESGASAEALAAAQAMAAQLEARAGALQSKLRMVIPVKSTPDRDYWLALETISAAPPRLRALQAGGRRAAMSVTPLRLRRTARRLGIAKLPLRGGRQSVSRSLKKSAMTGK
jgi:hypothetical protein